MERLNNNFKDSSIVTNKEGKTMVAIRINVTEKDAIKEFMKVNKSNLYEVAKKADIKGRSSMTKKQLAEAIIDWANNEGYEIVGINLPYDEPIVEKEVTEEVEEVSVGDLPITKDRMVVEPEVEENGSNTEDKWKSLVDYLIKDFVRKSLSGSRKLFFKPSKTEAFKEEMNKGISIYISVDKFLFAVVRDAIKTIYPQCPVDKKGNVNKSYIDQTLIEMSNRGFISKKEAYEGDTLTKRYWYATAEQLNNMYVLSKEEN